MIFDLLFYGSMALPAIYSVLNTKDKYTLEKHMISGLIIGMIVFFFGLFAGFEQAMGLPQVLSTSVPTIQGVSGLGPFGIGFAGFIASLVIYIVVAIVSYIVEYTNEKI